MVLCFKERCWLNFFIKKGIRVCLRYFKFEDLKRSFNYKISFKLGVVLSIFVRKYIFVYKIMIIINFIFYGYNCGK